MGAGLTFAEMGWIVTNIGLLIGMFIKIKLDIAKLQEQINADRKYCDAYRTTNAAQCLDHRQSINKDFDSIEKQVAEQRRYYDEMLKQNREDHNLLFDKLDKTAEKIDENFKILIQKVK